MSKIIIFYSRTGNTKTMAEEYAGEKGIDIYEIKDLVNRKGFIGFIKSAIQAVMKKSTPIEDVTIDISSYSRVILCTPIWVGTIPSPVRTFILKYGQFINKVEYIILYKNEKEEYKKTLDEMDNMMRKKRIRSLGIVTGKKK